MSEFESDGLILKGGVALDCGEGAFEFAGVGVDFGCDVVDDIFGEVDATEFGFGFEDCDACFEAWLCDLGDKSPLEAGDEAIFEVWDFRRSSVG